jgi:hypothetical protein
LASTQPAEPAPTTMKSNSCVMVTMIPLSCCVPSRWPECR